MNELGFHGCGGCTAREMVRGGGGGAWMCVGGRFRRWARWFSGLGALWAQPHDDWNAEACAAHVRRSHVAARADCYRQR